jgi:hypothetical protein
MQATGGDPPIDPPPVETQLQELATSDHAMLTRHPRPDRRLPLALLSRLNI